MSIQSQHRTNSILPQSSMAKQTGFLQRKCASCDTHTIAGDICDDCKDTQGVLRRKSPNTSEQSGVPPIVYEVVNSSGQPLDKTTRDFFEPRFEHDFSHVPVSSAPPQLSQRSLTIGDPLDTYEHEADRFADAVMHKNGNENKNERQGEKFDLSNVRVHTSERAAASARAVNALAYTIGNNIVFGAGQFAPSTHSGQQLIAHELAHVFQQSGSAGKIRRKVNYLKPPDIVPTDPVTTVLDNPNLALTTPKINGQLLPQPVIKNKVLDFTAAAKIIFSAFNTGVTIDRKGGKTTCKAKEPEVNVSSQISILEKPKSKVWQGSAPGTRFKDKAPACENVSNVTVYIKGKSGGDATSVYEKVMANEMEHVEDLDKSSKKHFEPHIEFLNKFNAPISNDPKTAEKECQDAFNAYIGKKDSLMIQAFLSELAGQVSVRDKKGGSHDFKPDVIVDGKDCFRVNVKI
jgi:hypothetical protein